MVTATALMYLRKKQINQVVVWYPNQILLEKDQVLYKNMDESLGGLDVKLVSSYEEVM